MTSPPPYVPDRFIPDDEEFLGEPPTCRAADCHNPDPEASRVPPGYCDSCFEERFGAIEPSDIDTTPECPRCGTPLMELGRGGETYCTECDTRDPLAPAQEQRREHRLRKAHNDGNFLPISASDWNDQGGGRR